MRLKKIFTLVLLFIVVSCSGPTYGGLELKLVLHKNRIIDKIPSSIISSVSVFNNSAGESIVYMGTEKGLAYSTDHGETWERQVLKKNVYGDEIDINVMSMVNSKNTNKFFIGTNKGLFYKDYSDKASDDFKSINVDNIEDLEIIVVAFDEILNDIYIGTRDKGIFFSDDGDMIDNNSVWKNFKGKDIANNKTKNIQDLSALEYATKIKNDPNFQDNNGYMKIEPYYYGKIDAALISNSISDIFVYNNMIYISTLGGGLSYTATPINDYSDFTTYTAPWYAFDQEEDDFYKIIEENRKKEARWTLGSNLATSVKVNNSGIYVGTFDGGLSFTSTGEAVGDHDTSDKILEYDYLGRKIYLTPPEEDPKTLSNVRLWHEFTTKKTWYATENYKSVELDSSYNLPKHPKKISSNSVKCIEFAKVNDENVILVGTGYGLAVATFTKTGTNAGEDVLDSEIRTNWNIYHKNSPGLIAYTVVNDIFIEPDETGKNGFVWVASDGQGLQLYQWVE